MGRLSLCGFAFVLTFSDASGQTPARSMWTLVRQAKESVPFLKQRLRPKAEVDAKKIMELLADLESSQFAVRKEAASALEEMGDLAEPALKQALTRKPSWPDTVRRKVDGGPSQRYIGRQRACGPRQSPRFAIAE
jgi:hypothetical protein